ncbi:MAG: hypothetical protein SFU98_04125 [Leptospiraceae bacterium]|nr:hypothetical protein [Leptospiraceae bacterium]
MKYGKGRYLVMNGEGLHVILSQAGISQTLGVDNEDNILEKIARLILG